MPVSHPRCAIIYKALGWIVAVVVFGPSEPSLRGGSAAAGTASPERQAVEHWPIRPAQTEPCILRWAEEYPRIVSLDKQKTYEGRTAYAVTVTSPGTDEAGKRRIFFSQPQRHEPATTAGMMDFGQSLDGAEPRWQPHTVTLSRVSAGAVLTFMPDYIDGRARMPEGAWDGKEPASDDDLQYVAFGRTQDGKVFPRVDRWNNPQQHPSVIGCAYEQINEHEFVEPNRDPESTFFKLIYRLRQQRHFTPYTSILHHQAFTRETTLWSSSLACKTGFSSRFNKTAN